jgi:hypothetical protein
VANARKFTDEEIAYIKCNFKSKTNREIAGFLGRTKEVISIKISQLGLKRDPKKSQIHRPTYTSWSSMITRCENKNRESWERYGGRGIKVCERWRSSFVKFVEDMGEKPEGYSIDRINPDGNYEPSNCRWIPLKDQSKTTSRFLTIGSCIDCGIERGNRKGRCHKCNEYFRRNNKARPPVKAMRGKDALPSQCKKCGDQSTRFVWGVCRKCFYKIYKPGMKRSDAESSGILTATRHEGQQGMVCQLHQGPP